MEYLNSIKKLGVKKVKEIFKEAKDMVMTTREPMARIETNLSSSRADLCSDED